MITQYSMRLLREKSTSPLLEAHRYSPPLNFNVYLVNNFILKRDIDNSSDFKHILYCLQKKKKKAGDG